MQELTKGSVAPIAFQIGYDDVYHYTTVWQENPSDAVIWADALGAKYEGVGKPFGRKECDALLAHCMVRYPILSQHSSHNDRTPSGDH